VQWLVVGSCYLDLVYLLCSLTLVMHISLVLIVLSQEYELLGDDKGRKLRERIMNLVGNCKDTELIKQVLEFKRARKVVIGIEKEARLALVKEMNEVNKERCS
jgi:hypothetical protein